MQFCINHFGGGGGGGGGGVCEKVGTFPGQCVVSGYSFCMFDISCGGINSKRV